MFLLAALFSRLVLAQDSRSIQLKAPQVDGGRPLMQALRDRSSSREFAPDKLPVEVLSNLFWAAFGINRPENEHRTAPSAQNMQEIDLYAATADGLFKYEPRTHQLVFILKEDLRAATGQQPYVAQAPLNVIYVADYSRMSKASSDERDFYAAADTGFISQNVYLYCASEGLATVVRASIDRSALSKGMKLRSDQKVTLAQSVGYPKK
jgi:SagB-type dehydrogenase family enzyme